MESSATDQHLLARQQALQDEARGLLTELDLDSRFRDLGPVLPTGSFVSGLMVWRDLDVMVLSRPDFAPADVLHLLEPVVDLPEVVGLAFRDERGPRNPTGRIRDDRYHVPITWIRHGAEWRIDLTVWLHDLHRNVTEWHERLRDTITPEQRAAVLRIKDAWHRRPSYPERVGGADVYAAVLEDGVRSPEAFAAWLHGRGLPDEG
jgi:hypothetical protein